MAKILGIETSCDETAAAIVDDKKNILSNVVSSHIEEHQPYGGVVPEISSRAHLRLIREVIQKAFSDADMEMSEIDAISVTAGPGLIGGVIVGVMTAKAMSMALGKPIIAVNHLEGHALTVRLTENVSYPYLLFLASGGHCQFLEVQGLGQYKLLGQTLDDALGECYDKVAKLLGLPYPGGPQVEERAKHGEVNEGLFPIPMSGRKGSDLSFSGLKTAVRQYTEKLGTLSKQDINDICASFQWAAAKSVGEKLQAAMDSYDGNKSLVFAGGVAANQYLRKKIESVCNENGYTLHVPPVELCTDNAAMIAWAGMEYYLNDALDDLNFEPKASWNLF